MSQPAARARWIDVTRGFAILFVVMHHAGTYERALFSVPEHGLSDIWLGMELLLYHLRLPLFFFISGALGSGHFSRSGEPRLNAMFQMARTYWLWGLILGILVPNWPMDGVGVHLDAWHFLGLIWGMSAAWYLWAIGLCFTFAFATRSLSTPGALIASLIAGGILQWELTDLGGSVQSLGRCLPLYMLGFRAPVLGGWIVNQHGLRKVTFPLVIYLSALGASNRFPIPDVILDLGGVTVGLLCVGLFLRKAPQRTAWLEWIGLRTLPIYLLHFPIIAALGCESIRLAPQWTPDHPLILVYVPLLAGLSVALGLLLYAMIVRAGGARLFMPPPLSALYPALFRRKSDEALKNEPLARRFPMDGETG